MNWESERDMERGVRENKELYEACAASPNDENDAGGMHETTEDKP